MVKTHPNPPISSELALSVLRDIPTVYDGPVALRSRTYHIHHNPDFVIKFLSPRPVFTEALNLALVRTMTSIPVPEVYQVIESDFGSYLVMEYIKGKTLDTCWSNLSFLRKLSIIWTIRGYISQLRQLRRSIPGTLDGSTCKGGFFASHGAGPFFSYTDMIRWLNLKLAMSSRFFGRPKSPADARPFNASSPLVFTHQDLCLRNIMIGDDATIYILDWEWAGFYPEWFEYAGMKRREDREPRLWRWCIPWMAGFHEKLFRRLCRVGWVLNTGFLL
ncbi:kinase-like domain-containing protein [Abortiporus biennis]|nr:kinase-like domain-containing protein [Abortiporus biennis]